MPRCVSPPCRSGCVLELGLVRADDPSGNQYEQLPEWIRNQIDKSRERMPVYEGDNRRPAPEPQAVAVTVDESDDIPF